MGTDLERPWLVALSNRGTMVAPIETGYCHPAISLKLLWLEVALQFACRVVDELGFVSQTVLALETSQVDCDTVLGRSVISKVADQAQHIRSIKSVFEASSKIWSQVELRARHVRTPPGSGS